MFTQCKLSIIQLILLSNLSMASFNALDVNSQLFFLTDTAYRNKTQNKTSDNVFILTETCEEDSYLKYCLGFWLSKTSTYTNLVELKLDPYYEWPWLG